MFRKLKFEEAIYSELKSIPLSTQYKLDAIGVRLRLETWNCLSREARLLFCQIPVKTDQDKECYRNYLLYLLKRRRRQVYLLEPEQTQKEKSEWENLLHIPDRVYQMAVDLDFTISPQDWLEMGEFQRYALVKLSRGNYDRNYLSEALEELLTTPAKVLAWKKKSPVAFHPEQQFVSIANG
jgi:hypothetical protein